MLELAAQACALPGHRLQANDGVLGDLPAYLMAGPAIPAGHPEAFHDAVARRHRCFEADVRAYQAGTYTDADGSKYATVADGHMGILFVEKSVESASRSGAWVDM